MIKRIIGDIMRLREEFICRGYNTQLSSWGHDDKTLKYEYNNENKSNVKVYKLSKEELEEYLKKFNR